MDPTLFSTFNQTFKLQIKQDDNIIAVLFRHRFDHRLISQTPRAPFQCVIYFYR
jgi:hypothetical protein